MYDKKNFLSLTQKKNLPKTKPPNKQLSKKRKRIIKKPHNPNKNSEVQTFFDFKNGKKKRIKTKIKSQDYETFFCLSKHFVSHLAYKKSMPKQLRNNEK